MTLGAVLAGGQSKRFGSDKAQADLDGALLIDRAIDAVRPVVGEVVICGRPWRAFAQLSDWPGANQGPLGGVCAALRHAGETGHEAVISVPVDCHPLTAAIIRSIDAPGDRVRAIEENWLIARWPMDVLEPLEAFLRSGRRAARDFLSLSNAIMVPAPDPLFNINFVSDLAAARPSPGGC